MQPVIEFSDLPNRVPLQDKLRRSAANIATHYAHVAECRSLAHRNGDDELVRLAGERLAELRESAAVIDELADEERIEL